MQVSIKATFALLLTIAAASIARPLHSRRTKPPGRLPLRPRRQASVPANPSAPKWL